MRRLLFILSPVLLLGLLMPTGIKKVETIDAKLLIGKWRPREKQPERCSRIIEYTRDGRLIDRTLVMGRSWGFDYVYRVDGDTLTSTWGPSPATIEVLTDDELVVRDDRGAKSAYSRVKNN